MKKFINEPAGAVHDYLVGLAAAHGDIVRYDQDARILARTVPGRAGKVGLVAGGGSGCEPTHTGFVGFGMLDAVSPGEIFTSPNPDQIIAATRAADRGGGVLHVIKNFTGEVMNFGMAEEILVVRGHRVALGADQRRCSGEGFARHGRAPRLGRDCADRADRGGSR